MKLDELIRQLQAIMAALGNMRVELGHPTAEMRYDACEVKVCRERSGVPYVRIET